MERLFDLRRKTDLVLSSVFVFGGFLYFDGKGDIYLLKDVVRTRYNNLFLCQFNDAVSIPIM